MMTLILLFLLLSGCSYSEVINAPKSETQDSTYVTRTKTDTTERKEIGFNITLEDWIE